MCLIPLFDGTAWDSVILTQSQVQGGHAADWGGGSPTSAGLFS